MSYYHLDRALLISESAGTASGRHTLRSGPGKRYALRITGPGINPIVVQPVELGNGMAPLHVELRRGAVVKGTIDDLPVSKYGRPSLFLVDSDDEHHAYPAGHRGLSLTSNDEFEFTGLPPGSFRLMIHLPRRAPIVLAEVRDLSTGSTRDLKLDGRSLHQARLRAHIRIDGVPRRAEVRLVGTRIENGDRRWSSPVMSDDAGEVVVVGEPGEYRVMLRLLETGSKVRAHFLSSQTVTIRAGEESTAQFEFTTRTFAARILDSRGEPAAKRSVDILWQGQVYPGGRLTTDARGRLSISHAPEGPFTIAVWPAHLTNRDAQRIYHNEHPDDWEKARIELPPVEANGGETRDLRLPR